MQGVHKPVWHAVNANRQPARDSSRQCGKHKRWSTEGVASFILKPDASAHCEGVQSGGRGSQRSNCQRTLKAGTLKTSSMGGKEGAYREGVGPGGCGGERRLQQADGVGQLPLQQRDLGQAELRHRLLPVDGQRLRMHASESVA